MANKQPPPNRFDFNDLFIFELSKNHGGDVAHGIRTVKAFGKIARAQKVRAAMKLQFQNLDTYIHPQERAKDDPRIKRYFASRLTEAEYKKIIDAIHDEGLISMSTPFDEESVDMLERLNVHVIKIASSSAADWPLLERIARSKKPVILSTGGLTMDQMDAVYAFFKKNGIHFAMMHCVSMYPTPSEHMHLHAISLMKQRYPDVSIGFSTHEHSDAIAPIQIAYSLGARLFEKHVILPNRRLESNLLYYKISTYTATAEQINAWINAWKDAVALLGAERTATYTPDQKEIETLRTMTRGVYAKRDIKKGEKVKREDVYFAIPSLRDHLASGKWTNGIRADKNYKKDQPLSQKAKTK